MTAAKVRFRIAALTILGVMSISSTPSPLSAQRTLVGVQMQSYRMSSPDAVHLQEIKLVSIPWEVDVPLAQWAALTLDGAWAHASAAAPNGSSARIQGPTTTQSRLALSSWGFTVTLHATAPADRGPMTLEETTVVGILASDLLPIELPRWTPGLGVGADVEYGLQAGRTHVKVAGGYSTIGDFTPLEGIAGPYAPGAQTHVGAALETEVGAASVVSVLVGFERFGVDTFDSLDFVSPGKRLETRISLALPIGARESALIYGGIYHRSRGEIGTSYGEINPIEVLLPGAGVPMSRDLVVAGSKLRASRGRLDVEPAAELRILRSAEGLGQGWLSSIEGRAEYHVWGERYGRGLLVEPMLAFRFGKILAEAGAESRMLGFAAGLTGSWSIGR